MVTALVAGEDRKVLVEAKERTQAAALFESLSGLPEQLVMHNEQRVVGLPPELAKILSTVVEVMARGGSVTIASMPEELTTTVAAEVLGVSRPTLMKMIRNGDIEAHPVRSHHRLKRADVLALKQVRLAAQRTAFDELRSLEDEHDLV